MNPPHVDAAHILTTTTVLTCVGESNGVARNRHAKLTRFRANRSDMTAYASATTGEEVPHTVGPAFTDRISIVFLPTSPRSYQFSRPRRLPLYYFDDDRHFKKSVDTFVAQQEDQAIAAVLLT